MEEENREEDVLELDGKPVLTAPAAPAEPDDGGKERPEPQDQLAGAEAEENGTEKRPRLTGTQGDRLPEAPAAAEADWRKPAAAAARAAQERARRDIAEAPGREDGETRASVFWPEKVEPVLQQDGADRSWAGARAGWRSGSLPGTAALLSGGGADGPGRGGMDRPGPTLIPGEKAGDVDRTGPESAARSGGLSRAAAGLEGLYRQTARTVRLEAPLPGGGAQTVVRVEEAAPAAALTAEKLDRAVRRDSRRYDGQMELF